MWIIPAKAIYQQALTAFQTREHPYRQVLERISGGEAKLLKKNARFTKQDIESQLCVMKLMLPAVNWQKGKAVEGVRAGLENEGLTGLGDAIRVHGDGDVP